MQRYLFTIGFAAFLSTMPSAYGATRRDGKFNVVCGAVQSIGAPADVSGTSQFFGVTLKSVTDYNPEDGIKDWTLGVRRSDENALGLALTFTAALIAQKNITIWWRHRDSRSDPLYNTVACAQTQDNDCPRSILPVDRNKCVADLSGMKAGLQKTR